MLLTQLKITSKWLCCQIVQKENQLPASFSDVETAELKIAKLRYFNSIQAVILSERANITH